MKKNGRGKIKKISKVRRVVLYKEMKKVIEIPMPPDISKIKNK